MDLGIDIFSKIVATCSKFHQLLQKTENKLHNVQFRHTTSIYLYHTHMEPLASSFCGRKTTYDIGNLTNNNAFD